ncbi:hypothetical protein BH09MYX1_BH09MYX1_00950 [soil metagenome]
MRPLAVALTIVLLSACADDEDATRPKTPTSVDLKRQREAQRERCIAGNVDACEARCADKEAVPCSRVAKAFASGSGRDLDPAEARRFYALACKAGDDESCSAQVRQPSPAATTPPAAPAFRQISVPMTTQVAGFAFGMSMAQAKSVCAAPLVAVPLKAADDVSSALACSGAPIPVGIPGSLFVKFCPEDNLACEIMIVNHEGRDRWPRFSAVISSAHVESSFVLRLPEPSEMRAKNRPRDS